MKKFNQGGIVMEYGSYHELRRAMKVMTGRGKKPITDEEVDKLWNGERATVQYGTGEIVDIFETDEDKTTKVDVL